MAEDLVDTLTVILETSLIDKPKLLAALGVALGMEPPRALNKYLARKMRGLWAARHMSSSQLISNLYLLLKDPDSEAAVNEVIKILT